METAFLLMAQYGPRAIIPIEWVARDYFPHIGKDLLIRKINHGQLPLPLVRIESSEKAAKGVHLVDLALWIDQQTAKAHQELAARRDLAMHDKLRSKGIIPSD